MKIHVLDQKRLRLEKQSSHGQQLRQGHACPKGEGSTMHLAIPLRGRPGAADDRRRAEVLSELLPTASLLPLARRDQNVRNRLRPCQRGLNTFARWPARQRPAAFRVEHMGGYKRLKPRYSPPPPSSSSHQIAAGPQIAVSDPPTSQSPAVPVSHPHVQRGALFV